MRHQWTTDAYSNRSSTVHLDHPFTWCAIATANVSSRGRDGDLSREGRRTGSRVLLRLREKECIDDRAQC